MTLSFTKDPLPPCERKPVTIQSWCKVAISLTSLSYSSPINRQQVYVPSGDLRSAVCYPSAAGGPGFADEEVERALTTVGLKQVLADLPDSLNSVDDWDMVLSSGQKARVSLARLLLNRPNIAALDEPVAHLQESARAPLLEQVFRELDPRSVVLVVTHDMSPDIVKLFNRSLHVDPDKTTLSMQ